MTATIMSRSYEIQPFDANEKPGGWSLTLRESGDLRCRARFSINDYEFALEMGENWIGIKGKTRPRKAD